MIPKTSLINRKREIGREKHMNFNDWKWLNESKMSVSENEISIDAPGHTDWFRNPVPSSNAKLDEPVANAPFFYREVTGDFVFCAQVRPNHANVYDAGALMVIENDTLWTKLAFEASDFGTTAAVCVVTNEVSDDANGCDIEQKNIWLKIVRVGNVFSTHYSLDGKEYHMVRLFHLPVSEKIKVGIEAQCPTGEGNTIVFRDIRLEHKTVHDLRKGI